MTPDQIEIAYSHNYLIIRKAIVKKKEAGDYELKSIQQT